MTYTSGYRKIKKTLQQFIVKPGKEEQVRRYIFFNKIDTLINVCIYLLIFIILVFLNFGVYEFFFSFLLFIALFHFFYFILYKCEYVEKEKRQKTLKLKFNIFTLQFPTRIYTMLSLNLYS